MGFHRTIQPQALDRATLTEVIGHIVDEQIAFAMRCADPFLVDHDCLNPVGHDFIPSCGGIVCPHCSRVFG